MTIINPIGDQVYKLFIQHGFNWIQAGYITAQTAHETANYTSNVFNQANNLFGMKYAGQFLATGEYNGYAKYLTLDDCVADFIGYYGRRGLQPIYKSLFDYVEALKAVKYL